MCCYRSTCWRSCHVQHQVSSLNLDKRSNAASWVSDNSITMVYSTNQCCNLRQYSRRDLEVIRGPSQLLCYHVLRSRIQHSIEWNHPRARKFCLWFKILWIRCACRLRLFSVLVRQSFIHTATSNAFCLSNFDFSQINRQCSVNPVQFTNTWYSE
jgi:hypothetical protein